MESDVASFQALDRTLSIGESTVGTARGAAESVADLLVKIQTKILSAQEAGTSSEDRAKIQDDIDGMKKQIASITQAAQINGKNLIDGSTLSPMQVTSSLDRSADGTVRASTIDVETWDLRSYGLTGMNGEATAADGGGVVNVSGALAFQGGGGALSATDLLANGSDVTGLLAGDVIAMSVNGTAISYTVAEGDDATAVLTGLNAAKTAAGIGGTLAEAGGVLTFDAGTGAGDFEVSTTVGRGGLAGLATLDVTQDGGPAAALEAMEGLIKIAVDAASAFGSSQGRIEIQRDFIGKLTDSMKSGIGALVDADMEEASARLQALQVQQQLGTQSLSIANQAPQALLSLFR